MMGERRVAQEALFYEFSLDQHVPANNLLRAFDRFVDLSGLREHLRGFYSTIGRPSIDSELMLRMLIVGYCFGIRSAPPVRGGAPQSGLPLVLPPRSRGRRAGSLHLLKEPPLTLS